MIGPNRPLLIAHVVYRFDIGGLENGVVNLINRLPESSWRHAVLALSEVSPVLTQRVQRQDVQYLSLHKSSGHLVEALSAHSPIVPRTATGSGPHTQPGSARGCSAGVGSGRRGTHTWRTRA